MKSTNPSVRVTVEGQPAGPPVAGELKSRTGSPQSLVITPPIDIYDGPEGLTLEADLPGATDQNLQIQLEGNVLSLHAKLEPQTPGEANLIHEEFPVGDYYRSFILSDDVDRDRITAELKNGVLRLVLPKADRLRSRKIEIRS